MSETNRTIAEKCYDALEEAAHKRNEALTRERKAKRIYAEIFLRETGSIEERRNKAMTSPLYVEAEDAFVGAESAHNLAKARADGAQILFEEWRTKQATLRAEMTMQ